MDDKNPDNDPTPEQNKEMVRAAAKTFEALDRELNDWEPSTDMPETRLDPE
jgi:hypothetical protein